jgi:hypothetical protein
VDVVLSLEREKLFLLRVGLLLEGLEELLFEWHFCLALWHLNEDLADKTIANVILGQVGDDACVIVRRVRTA